MRRKDRHADLAISTFSKHNDDGFGAVGCFCGFCDPSDGNKTLSFFSLCIAVVVGLISARFLCWAALSSSSFPFAFIKLTPLHACVKQQNTATVPNAGTILSANKTLK
jgi:hypothetical protein